MRMRGVEKNISLRDAKFGICQPEVCAVPGVVVAAGGVRQWVSGMSVFLSRHSNKRFLLQLLLARITNHSLQRLLVTSSFLLITFGDAKLVN